MNLRRTAVAVTGVVLLALTAAACNRGSNNSNATSGGGSGKVGIDLPPSDSDFWNSYAKYIDSDITSMGVSTLTPTESSNDITKLAANVQSLVAQGAKAIVMAPQDTAAVAPTLSMLAGKNIPAISVDTRPDTGQVYMVVRADNRAYGTKACMFLGQKLNNK